jgi:hypothetical protein
MKLSAVTTSRTTNKNKFVNSMSPMSTQQPNHLNSFLIGSGIGTFKK